MNRRPRDAQREPGAGHGRPPGPQALAERRLQDMQEANAHLVHATLAAEQLGEAAKRVKRQQDEFIAMLAHELRNPLAPIRSAATLLERLEPVDPRVKAISDIVGRQVAHMARLLDDLLDASRVTSGKVTLRRRPTSVAEFVDEAVETTRSLIESQHQTLTLTLPPSPLYVNGDPTRLAQVVGNLLHNASKYTPDDGAIDLPGKGQWSGGDGAYGYQSLDVRIFINTRGDLATVHAAQFGQAGRQGGAQDRPQPWGFFQPVRGLGQQLGDGLFDLLDLLLQPGDTAL